MHVYSFICDASKPTVTLSTPGIQTAPTINTIRYILLVIVFLSICTIDDYGVNQLLPEAYAIGSNSWMPTHNTTKGKVFRRGVVLNKDQYSYFARYSEEGEVLEVIPSSPEDMDQYIDAFVMSREEFLDEKRRANDKAINGRIVQTREEYDAKEFKTVSNDSIDLKPPLKASSNSVLIRAPEELYLSSIVPIVEEYRISKDGAGEDVSYATVSLIIDKYGDVKNQYDDPVAFLTSYKKVDDLFDDLGQYASTKLSRTDTVLNPLQSVFVSSPYALFGFNTITDSYGKYTLTNSYQPCPGFSYFNQYYMAAKIPYLAANPVTGRFARYISVFAPRPSVAACSDYGVLATSSRTLLGQYAGISTSLTEQAVVLKNNQENMVRDIPISLFVLRGQAGISNQVEPYSESDYFPQPEINYAESKTKYMDLYTSADGSVDFYSQSLLEKITLDDFKKTDVYVFRDSTGELVAELVDGAGMAFDFFDKAETKHRLSYSIVIPAFDQHSVLRYGKGRESGIQYGEYLDVVIINRATGYLSMQVLQAKPEANGVEVVAGATMMRPPNLKIHVVRDFYTLVRPDTLQAIDNSHIGFEGSGLTSDKHVVLKTDWRDHSGRLLPAELPGYTGRITMVVDKEGTSELAADEETEGVEQFAITPNEHYQLITLPTPSAPQREHFYVHVNGEQTEGDSSEASFDTDPDATGILKYRPKYTVPILVQVADIYASSELKRVLIDEDKADNYQPIYRWVYRPESHYTLFDFYATLITPVEPYSTQLPPDTQIIDLMADPTLLNYAQDGYAMHGPLKDSTDPYSYLNPLERFGTERREFSFQLVDAYGDPIAVNIDEYGKVSISDPYALAASDFSVISLFQNDDPENILWSRGLYVWTSEDSYSNAAHSFVVPTKEGIMLSNDTTLPYPMNPFKVTLLGNFGSEYTIKWRIKVANGKKIGKITIESPESVDSYPPTTSTSEYTKEITKSGSDSNATELRFKPYLTTVDGQLVIPHEPDPFCKNPAGCGGTKQVDVTNKNPRLTYDVSVEVSKSGVKIPSQSYSVRIAMDDPDVIRQEYLNHYQLFQNLGNGAKKRINCIAYDPDSTDGYCSGDNSRKMPAHEDMIEVTPTENYPDLTPPGGACKDSGVRKNCVDFASGNYAEARLAFGGNPLKIAESVRTKFNPLMRTIASANDPYTEYQKEYCRLLNNSDLTILASDKMPSTNAAGVNYCNGSSPVNGGAPIPAADETPVITSSWRNPERNEFVTGQINSKHQFGAAADLSLLRIDSPDFVLNKLHWCMLAKAARGVPDQKGVLVENNGHKIAGTNVTTILGCYNALEADDLAPTHVHIGM